VDGVDAGSALSSIWSARAGVLRCQNTVIDGRSDYGAFIFRAACASKPCRFAAMHHGINQFEPITDGNRHSKGRDETLRRQAEELVLVGVLDISSIRSTPYGRFQPPRSIAKSTFRDTTSTPSQRICRRVFLIELEGTR
jgi:hypothetical protein